MKIVIRAQPGPKDFSGCIVTTEKYCRVAAYPSLRYRVNLTGVTLGLRFRGNLTLAARNNWGRRTERTQPAHKLQTAMVWPLGASPREEATRRGSASAASSGPSSGSKRMFVLVLLSSPCFSRANRVRGLDTRSEIVWAFSHTTIRY